MKKFLLLTLAGHKDKIILDETKAMILTEFQKEKLISFDAEKLEITLLSDNKIVLNAILH